MINTLAQLPALTDKDILIKEIPEDKVDPGLQTIKDKLIDAAYFHAEVEIPRIKESFLRERQLKRLINGYSPFSYIKEVTTPKEFFDFLTELKSYSKEYPPYFAKTGNDPYAWVYTFNLPFGYTAFTDQIKFGDIVIKDLTNLIRYKHNICLRPRRYISPEMYLKYAMQTTRLVSFIYSTKKGLLRWRTGIFADTLYDANERKSWIAIDPESL